MKGLKTALFGITVLAVLAFAGVGAGVASSGSSARLTAVASGPSALGRIIVDSHGRTLYLFEKDRRGASACSGACLVYWPPLLKRSADRDQGSQALSARQHPTSRRHAAGDLRGTPALSLLRGRTARADQRRRSEGLRSRLVRAHAFWQEDRSRLRVGSSLASAGADRCRRAAIRTCTR